MDIKTKNRSDSKTFLARIAELEETVARLKFEKKTQEQQSRATYRRLIDATSEGFLELDLELNITDYNSALESMLQIPGEPLLQTKIENYYDSDSVFIHFASKDHLSFEAEFNTGTGKKRPILFKRSILRDSEGRPNSYLVFCTDLTELKKAQQELQKAENKYRDIYKNASQGMYQTTLAGKFLRVNPAFAKIFGFQQTAQVLFQPGGVAGLYKRPEDRKLFLDALGKHKLLTNYEVEMQDREGKTVWVMINARLSTDANGETIVEGILIDNTKKRLAEDKLRQSRERFRYLANHDSLTGLYNTRYLYRALDDLITESTELNKPFSLVFLDMDNFKRVVDTHGHLNGSQALKEVAATIKKELVEPSFGVAYGGDEFVLVLPNTNKDVAVDHVNQIRQLMKDTVYLTKYDLEVQMSASFGIATFPDDAEDKDGLLALADEAMFRIKTRGKDAVGVSSSENIDA